MAESNVPVLEVRDLKKHFPIRKGLLRRHVGNVYAVDGISFTIGVGETLGLVGESGCGKTTAGRTVLRLTEPTSGSIEVGGTEITGLSKADLRPYRRQMQIIFQDPFSSLNPRMSVGQIIEEGLIVNKLGENKGDRLERVQQAAIPEGSRDLDRLGVSAALWVGTPGGPESVAFHAATAGESITIDRPDQIPDVIPDPRPRVWFLEHDGDPVVRFRPKLLLNRPAWLPTDGTRGRNVPEAMTWKVNRSERG